jgi:glycosyltransferase involved in cell wall biosynthesis
MIKSVIFFNLKFGKHIGGTEAYTAELINFFDKKLPVFIKPARNARKYNLKRYMLDYYNIQLENTVLPCPFLKGGLFINVSWNTITHFHKYSIHIIHFSNKLQLKLRKNLYKFFLSIIQKITYSNAYSFYICNSNFTKNYFKKFWPQIPAEKIKVLYPPVKLFTHTGKERKRQIVVCSRLDPEKKIECLIDTYNKYFFCQNVKLIIIGSVSNNINEIYLKRLRSSTNNNNSINFLINTERNSIEEIFNETLIFWHAKGFGETDPGLFEHFGITTVEAMSTGIIPIVINKGGQCEIVDHGINGYKWDTLDELRDFTQLVLDMSHEKLNAFSKNAIHKAMTFSASEFNVKFLEILSTWQDILPTIFRS